MELQMNRLHTHDMKQRGTLFNYQYYESHEPEVTRKTRDQI